MNPSPEDIVFPGQWITLSRLPRLAGSTTDRYEVRGEDRTVIARIRWYGAWHKYALFPETGTLWEPTCLREIASLLERLTRQQRQSQPLKGVRHE